MTTIQDAGWAVAQPPSPTESPLPPVPHEHDPSRADLRLGESEARYLKTLLRLADANYREAEIVGWRSAAGTHATALLAELERIAHAMGWALD